MSQDRMREAFEDWASNYPALEDDQGRINLRYLALHKQYVDFAVQRAWRAFQAGHASAQAPAAKPLNVDAVRDLIDGAGLDWHNGWTIGDDATNRYLDLARAIERAHGIGMAAAKEQQP